MKEIYCDSSTKEACVVINEETHIMPYKDAPVTVNTGEYRAVLWAFELLMETDDAVPAIIYTDSKLVVEQGYLRWKCKKPHLKLLRDEVNKWLEIWWYEIDLKWISREENLAGKVLEGR